MVSGPCCPFIVSRRRAGTDRAAGRWQRAGLLSAILRLPCTGSSACCGRACFPPALGFGTPGYLRIASGPCGWGPVPAFVGFEPGTRSRTGAGGWSGACALRRQPASGMPLQNPILMRETVSPTASERWHCSGFIDRAFFRRPLDQRNSAGASQPDETGPSHRSADSGPYTRPTSSRPSLARDLGIPLVRATI